MKVIIAGSRTITKYEVVKEAVESSGFEITEVVSGGCHGVDLLGEKWAEEKGIPITQFPADWNNISQAPVRIKYRSGRAYNALAGFNRNERMAEYADALIAITTGSNGTADMIKRAITHNLKIFIVKV